MQATMPTKTKWTPKEIAEVLDRHPESIRINLRNGDLKGHKMGREWIVLAKDLRAWLGSDLFDAFFGDASTGDGAA
jgi:hypothetical protein